jgi:hypothetical protein
MRNIDALANCDEGEQPAVPAGIFMLSLSGNK